jgi:predicted nucleotidyltransferase
LFWSPKSADDKAVRTALTGIDRHKGKVLAHATNVKRIAAYGQITRGADVEQSPTVVVVDRDRKVETLVGYVDRTSIDQAVTDALRNS